jgi:uncharacterized protein YyaL (SSP411 family)
MAALALAKLGKFTASERYIAAAETTMQACVTLMQRFPSGTAQMLLAVDFYLGPTHELVFAGDCSPESNSVLADIQRRFLPHKVFAYADGMVDGPIADLLAGKTMISGEPTLYVCEGFACQTPVHRKEAIARAIDAV